MQLTKDQITEIAKSEGLTYAQLRAFMEVESGGQGFINGKIVIQFEPSWFRKKAPFAPSGLWSINKVDNQTKEWLAFNDAFKKNPTAAMLSTSIGAGQIMGFHHLRLGFKTVNEMWDDFKNGEYQQVKGMAKFISSDTRLKAAIKALNWHRVAELYNGAGYMDLAKKYGREPYNISLEKAYRRFLA